MAQQKYNFENHQKTILEFLDDQLTELENWTEDIGSTMPFDMGDSDRELKDTILPYLIITLSDLVTINDLKKEKLAIRLKEAEMIAEAERTRLVMMRSRALVMASLPYKRKMSLDASFAARNFSRHQH